MALKRVFEPYTMRGVTLKNRFVFAGHGSRFVDFHTLHLTAQQGAYLAERARGGVGLIIQGSCIVHPTGQTFGGINQCWDDSCIAPYAAVVDEVHAAGAKIFAQMSHLGRQGSTFPTHRELWSPSDVPDPTSRVVPHVMTKRDIAELIESYRSAARRLLAAGFDGLEVYMAHGYLLAAFLSGFSNRRTDEYGGSLENRMRLPLAVLAAVREVVGDKVPVGIRISAEEFVPDGLHPEEAREIVQRLADAVAFDFISVTQSNYATIDRMIPDMSFPRAPFVHFAEGIRAVAGGIPVMAVARIVDPEKAEEIIEDGKADFVCMVRPLIADPELPRKAQEDRLDEIRRCISCNVGCRGGPHRGLSIACLVNPAVGFERTHGVGKIGQAETARHVVVVGGGPAGLKTAETAALRGHRVTLLEATDKLGGTMLLAARAMDYRAEFANAPRFLESECRRLGVDIRLNSPATVESIAALSPDRVVVATGARPGRPSVPGLEEARVYHIADAIDGRVEGKRVLVVDSGEADWKVLTTAEGLAARGHEITLLSPVAVGAEIDIFSKPPLLRRLGAAGLRFFDHHSLRALAAGAVTIRDNWSGKDITLDDIDAVVLSWYGVADHQLADELEAAGHQVERAGDCLAPRRAIDAIWDGFRIGNAL